MSAAIQKAVETAFKVFSRRSGGSVPYDSLEELKSHLNRVTKSELRLSPKILDDRISEAPVTYIRILEDNLMTVAVFILRQGKRLPLHDHPGMYGLLKVVHGKISIRSYTPLHPENYQPPPSVKDRIPVPVPVLPAKYEGHQLCSETDGCCVISPDTKNLHEIHSETDCAAFLDILSPPYSHNPDPGYRPCTYFREIEKDPDDTSIRYLVQTGSPHDYWCDEETYRGPEVVPPPH